MRVADLLDWLYPRVEPMSSSEIHRRKQRKEDCLRLVDTHTDPKAVVDGYAALCAEEQERLKSVEARLSGVLGLVSITSSLLIGGIFALVNGALSDSTRPVRVLACVALVYLSLQIISSTLAAIRGLGRATWIGSTIRTFSRLWARDRQNRIGRPRSEIASDTCKWKTISTKRSLKWQWPILRFVISRRQAFLLRRHS